MANQNHKVAGSLFDNSSNGWQSDIGWDINTGVTDEISDIDNTTPGVPDLAALIPAVGVPVPHSASSVIVSAVDAAIGSEPYLSVPETAGKLTINLEFDAAAQAAPAAFRTGLENAASLLAAAISIVNASTINLDIEYNEDDIGPGSADAGPSGGLFEPYATVRSDLIADAPAGDTNFNALPTGTSIQGYSQIAVWDAQLKVLGLMSGSGSEIDGTADFSADIATSSLVGVGLHELAHALGRVPYGGSPDIFDLFRFTSRGTILVDDSIPAAAQSYFSVNGGTTDLADYGNDSDPSDFLNAYPITVVSNGVTLVDVTSTRTPEDAFDQSYDPSTFQTLTAVDLKQLDVLGFGTACYCAGTLILTDRGEVPVEDLHPGMLVMTASGEARPVRWIGFRALDFTRHPAPDVVRPIRIEANAIDHGMPRRDLRLSPEHAVFIDGLMIPARRLLNDTTIRRDMSCDATTYYHVELESHDVLLAEGLPAESYLDTGNRGMFANGGEPIALHPDFPGLAWDGFGCAPLTIAGAALDAIRARLDAIAANRVPPIQEAARRRA